MKDYRKIYLLFLFAFILFSQQNAARAAITCIDNVFPTDPSTWTSSTTAFIGITKTGTVTVDSGSGIFSNSTYIGYSSTASGQVTVSGIGSTWANSTGVYIGASGTGLLNIIAGGIASSKSSYIGDYYGANGIVTVNGVNSKWTNSADLYVGKSGKGTLNITDGGNVIVATGTYVAYNPDSTGTIHFDNGTLMTSSLEASPSQLEGIGTINTLGLVSDVDLLFNSTASLNQAIILNSLPNQSITLNLDMSNPSDNGNLGAGWKGNGSLTIRDGTTINSPNGFIGYHSTSTGVATVTGPGSRWSVSSDLYVGNSGNGALNISDGAAITVAKTTFVAKSSGSISTIGFNNGTLTTSNLYVSPSQITGTGTINAIGLVSDIDLVFNSTASLNQSILLNSTPDQNITLNLNMSNPSGNVDLGAGWKGNGSLTIRDGTTINSNIGFIGYQSTAKGVVTVTGTGSKWINSTDLYVGYSGSGALNIINGGTINGRAVINAICFIGYNSGSTGVVTVDGANTKLDNFYCRVGNYGKGTLNITGGTVDYVGGSIGYNSGSTGVVTVDGANSKLIYNTRFYIGDSGNGTLNITAGGTVINFYDGDCRIGYNSGSTGVVTVDGANSKWTDGSYSSSNTYIDVGYSGHGTLNITGGGTVRNQNGYIGYSSGSTGVVTVDGANSNWTNSRVGYIDFFVGCDGHGTLNVTAGGNVSTYGSHIGANSSSTGVATVDGANSKWTNGSDLYVGSSGKGSLYIVNGGAVSNYAGRIGGRECVVTVDGANSKWTNGSYLSIGGSDNSGNGTLNIINGGAVSATSVYINSKSLLAIDVGRGSSLRANNGSSQIYNNGKIRIFAGADATPGGTYAPIVASAWNGSGVYQAVGGTWDATAHTFTVSTVLEGLANAPLTIDLASQQRLLVHDTASEWAIAASFAPKTTSTLLELTASPIDGQAKIDLQTIIGDNQPILGGWRIATNDAYTTGDPAYLSFDIGSGHKRNELTVWHFDGSDWTEYNPSGFDLTCNGDYASFTVTGFSGYAITAVPEPGALILLASGLLSLLVYIRRARKAK